MAGMLIAPVEDGKIVETESQASLAKAKEKEKKSGYSKDTFLQLLVAEVQNQDPLQPTSNTEWVSQYATFSQLEAITNMSSSYDMSRATSLVGKSVVINAKDASGKTNTVEGKVDYVTYEGGKAFLSVNGGLYSLDDVYNVVDSGYMTAFNKVYEWSVKLNKLPAYASLTYQDADRVEEVYNEYDKMSDYEKSFVAGENSDKIKKLYERIQELKKIHAGSTGETKPENKEPAGTEGTKPENKEPAGTEEAKPEEKEPTETGGTESSETKTEEPEKP